VGENNPNVRGGGFHGISGITGGLRKRKQSVLVAHVGERPHKKSDTVAKKGATANSQKKRKKKNENPQKGTVFS